MIKRFIYKNKDKGITIRTDRRMPELDANKDFEMHEIFKTVNEFKNIRHK